jgi:integrase/recombinase XerD
MIGVTTAIIHDKRIKRKDGTYAVKLRITFNRAQNYYPIGTSLSIDDWDKVHSEKPRGKFKEHLLYFNKIEEQSVAIIREMPVFSFALFEKKFNQKPKANQGILEVYSNYISELKQNERISTAYSYNNAKQSVTKFLESKNRKKIAFWEITTEWLNNYEKWMLESGNSITTVGIYMRSLRTIINVGIQNGLFDKDLYPFGKRKYQIPSGRNLKKALSLADISSVVNYQTKTVSERRSRDLWVFSYLCNGANIKDIANLKFKNIEGNRISFIRAKTSNSTKQDRQAISVFILPEIQAIINEWGVDTKEPEDYIFGILSKDDTPEQEYAKIYQATKTINKYMKEIGKDLKFTLKLTTYTARHSFATVLKRSGAPTEFISESLGHKDLKTTENYLDSFEDDMKESYQKQLLNFTKTKPDESITNS